MHAPTSILPDILYPFVAPASNNNCSTPQRRGAAPYAQAPHHSCWKSVVKNISIMMMSDFISLPPRVVFRTQRLSGSHPISSSVESTESGRSSLTFLKTFSVNHARVRAGESSGNAAVGRGQGRLLAPQLELNSHRPRQPELKPILLASHSEYISQTLVYAGILDFQ